MKFRKKPVVAEAFKLGIDPMPDWFMDKVSTGDIILYGTSSGFMHNKDTRAAIKTLEGVMGARYGDYIIKGVNGEIYSCKPDIFKKTYEAVTNTQFDRIKAMSVEEMAEYFALDKHPSTPCYVCEYDNGLFCSKEDCNPDYKIKVFKEYLEREV